MNTLLNAQLNAQLNVPLNTTDFIVDKAEQPIARLLLAHGAGAPMASDYLQQLAQQLAAQGIEVWRFNFCYMAKTVAGKKQPSVFCFFHFFRHQIQVICLFPDG